MIGSEVTKARINELRNLMNTEHVDICLFTVGDHHMSEYVCDHFKILEFFSGFSGSRAKLVVSRSEAFLFTDGRYFLEAEEVLRGTGITLMREGTRDVPEINELIGSKLSEGYTLGLDARYFSIKETKELCDICSEHGCRIDSFFTAPEFLMTDRKPLPHGKLFILDEEYSGMSTEKKLSLIRSSVRECGCDTHILSDLADIAYILNLRGSDIPFNPLFLSYLVITMDDAVLFVASDNITPDVRNHLSGLNVQISEYSGFYEYIQRLNGKMILLDESRVNQAVFESLKGNEIYSETNPSSALKAVKNETEQENLRKANLADAVAFVRFLYEFEKRKESGEKLCENDIAEMIQSKRALSEQYISESFSPIIAAGKNAAIVHYEHKGKGKNLDPNDPFLLMDTGGHYLWGTTDVTRTVVTGVLNNEQKTMYTRVLKANMAVSEAVFKKGTTGAGLDILARRELWRDGLDYRHGTGHGIGYLLSVHEGPFSLSYNTRIRSNLVPLEPGMLLSDEPGYYKDGEYGIRTENDLLVVPFKETEYGEFYRFEVLTLIPFDPRAIDRTILTPDETDSVLRYHKRILSALSNYLSDDEEEWFKASFISPLS